MNAVEVLALVPWVVALGLAVSNVVRLERIIAKVDRMIARLDEHQP